MPDGSPETVLILACLTAAPVILALLWWFDVIRPGSFRRAGLREVEGVPGFVWILCGVSMYLTQFAGMAAGMAAVLGAGLATPEQLNSPQMPLAAQALVFGVTYGAELAAAALLLYLLFARVGPKSGIRWRWRDPLVGAGILLVAAPVYITGSMLVQFVAEQVDPGSIEVIAHDTLRQMLDERGTPWFWAMCAAVVVGAPVAEEIIFRLLIQSAVLRWTKSAWAAIGATGILFGAVHLGSVPWYAAIVLGLVGVILGIAFERTKRIGVPIVMHALFNAVQIAASLLIFPGSAAPPGVGGG